MIKPYHISFIGSGNVATHLAFALKNAGNNIDAIISPNPEHHEELAQKLNCQAFSDVAAIPNTTEVLIIAAKDDAIASIVKRIGECNCIVAHTSGSIGIDALSTIGQNTGVFYPLQTFHKNKDLDISQVPFCIEASNKQTEEVLMQLAQGISQNVQLISSAERKILHVAAVFACNFTNHFYAIASDILSKEDLSLDLLRPLILETAQQMQSQEPKDLQTGPAKRNDVEVINRHLAYLASNAEYAKLYELITESIKRGF